MGEPVYFEETTTSGGGLTLNAGEVHLWYIPLTEPDSLVEQLYATLAADEQERADRFVRPYLRRRFAVGRGRQREILAAYVDSSPEQLEYQYGPLGKPSLTEACNRDALEFNLTNSRELALLAVTREVEIGVDVEFVREVRDLDLARRFFATTEVKSLESLGEGDRERAFFNGWTRKEALLKAVGTGLSFPLTDVVVTMSPDEPCRLLRFDYESDRAEPWWLHSLLPATGYVAAIAAQLPAPVVRYCRLGLSAD